MTENEAIQYLRMATDETGHEEFSDVYKEMCSMAIQALEEIPRYRDLGTIDELAEMQVQYNYLSSKIKKYESIGTVEECRTAYGRGYNQGTIDRADEIQKAREHGYAKAIDECYMKAKTLMEELSYQNQGRRNGKTHRVYCIQALEFLRQVAEQILAERKGE